MLQNILDRYQTGINVKAVEMQIAQPPSEEDSIEVQDNLLKLTQCLRDKGLDVPDPEFSGGDPRMALRSIAIKVQQIEGSIDSVRSCGEEIFGGSLRRSR